MTFQFVDLFAGIGGFHAALSGLGGECVMASEIDKRAVEVYRRNWGDQMKPSPGRPMIEGDILPLTPGEVGQGLPVEVPPHDVLAAGFPCQPFSKSGRQQGMEEARGTLFYNILRVLEFRRPSIVLLENVRNLHGPRHRHEWKVIIKSLRDLGYRVSDEPSIYSPHLLPPWKSGRPQVRERVYITGTYIGDPDRAREESGIRPAVINRPEQGWDPESWDVEKHLLLPESGDTRRFALDEDEVRVIDLWDDLLRRISDGNPERTLPGFPLWADAFVDDLSFPDETPLWKKEFLAKNAAFYRENASSIEAWKRANPLLGSLPPSRRKFEWQAKGASSLWETVMQFRPSGLRAKLPNYLPALVAITQTSIIGSRRRRITPREAARLQGFPDSFEFGDQPDSASYRQLGNAVCVPVVSHVLRAHVARDASELPDRLRGLASGPEGHIQLSLLPGSS